jgi:hypothetical protein
MHYNKLIADFGTCHTLDKKLLNKFNNFIFNLILFHNGSYQFNHGAIIVTKMRYTMQPLLHILCTTILAEI